MQTAYVFPPGFIFISSIGLPSKFPGVAPLNLEKKIGWFRFSYPQQLFTIAGESYRLDIAPCNFLVDMASKQVSKSVFIGDQFLFPIHNHKLRKRKHARIITSTNSYSIVFLFLSILMGKIIFLKFKQEFPHILSFYLNWQI